MKENYLSFSIENILKNNDKSKERNEDDRDKQMKRNEEVILETINYHPTTQWNGFNYNNGQSSKITTIVNFCGTYLENVSRDCNCESILKFSSQTNFHEKLKIRRIGHPYQSRAPPKRKPCRNTFTHSQVLKLEKLFQQTKYLSSSERKSVAKELNMTDNQLKTWYQNRRTKLKRELNELKEQQQQQQRQKLAC